MNHVGMGARGLASWKVEEAVWVDNFNPISKWLRWTIERHQRRDKVKEE